MTEPREGTTDHLLNSRQSTESNLQETVDLFLDLLGRQLEEDIGGSPREEIPSGGS